MAALPITIVGTLTGKATKEGDVSATEQVVIQGGAFITGLEIGGGPMPGGPPPQVWPGPGHPAFPIWGGPGFGSPGGPYPPSAEHPIVLPPDLPPALEDGRLIDWKVGWTPDSGWAVIGVPQFKHPTPSK
jgi:hypothetical protein